jgi:hypothetical protein
LIYIFSWITFKKKHNMIESADNNEKDKAKKPETGAKTPVLDNFSRDLN